jgi:hypothetical protein
MDADYWEVLIETYRARGEPSGHDVRARPVPGQGFPRTMKVECSSSMRYRHPVGTKFIVRAKLTDREGGTPFLYTSWQWKYQVVSEAEAQKYLKARKTSR